MVVNVLHIPARVKRLDASAQPKNNIKALLLSRALSQCTQNTDAYLPVSGTLRHQDDQMSVPCENGAPTLTFDGANVVSAWDGADKWHFVHAPNLDDPLIGLLRISNGTRRELFWITDGNGREFVVADSTGNRPQEYDFDYAWSGWQYAGGTKNAQSFDASRQESPALPGFSFFRNRVYDQNTGRWTQEDPIGLAGGINLYQFNGNNPATYSDPFGLVPCPPCKEALAVAGGVAAIDGPLPVGDVVAAGITLGVGILVVGDAVSGVYNSIRNNVHDSRLRGQARNIGTHFDKLANPNEPGGDDPRNRQKWKDDIQRGIDRMRTRI